MKRTTIAKRVASIVLGTLMGISICGCTGIKKERPIVQLSVWGSEQDQEALQLMVDSFVKEHSNEADLKITVCEESESTCKDTVLMSPAAAADVFFFADDQLGALVAGDALLEVTDNKDEIMDSVGGADSVAVEASSQDGHMYAYPCTASNGYFLYYNSNYFSAEDVKSLEKILDICEKNGKKFAMEMTSGWYMYSFYTAAGLNVGINGSGTANVCDWADETKEITGADVTQKLIDLAKHKGFLNANNDEFLKGIKDGTVIAGISGTWNATDVQQAFENGYAACKLPTYNVNGKDLQLHSVAGYKLTGVNKYTNHEEWAVKLACWLTNEENQLLRFEKRGEGPANIKAAASEEVQASVAIAALSEQMQYGHIQRVEGSYWDESYKLGNIIVAGNIEGKPVEQLMDELVKGITQKKE